MDVPGPSLGEKNATSVDNKAETNKETTYNDTTLISKLLYDGGYEPFQDENTSQETVRTAWDVSTVDKLKAFNSCKDYVPFPGVSQIALCSSVTKPVSIINGKITSKKLLDVSEKDDSKDISDETIQQHKNATSSVELGTDNTSLFVHLDTGEDLHLVDNLDDMTVENIEDGTEQNEENTDESDIFNINDLPQELLHKILTYMTQYDLCHSVACCCKLWRELAYDPIHWQKLDFKDRSVTSGTLMQCIKRATRLKQLRWHDDLTLDEVNIL